jgi:putative RNA 2'-phosphotransferase
MKKQKALKQLTKFIAYALGHRPDELGLVLDPHGFIKIKEFLKAIHEGEDFKYVRRSHLEELVITLPDPPIEIKGNSIRAKYRDKLSQHSPAQNLPKLLYTCVRRRAYPVVLEKGIFPTAYSQVVLSSRRDLAERMGKRFDPMPVLLTVHTSKPAAEKIVFYRAGATLFLAESIRQDCFTGPPLPKQKVTVTKQDTPKERKPQKLSGSFIIDLKDKKDHPKASDRKQQNVGIPWQKDAKRLKKRKLKKQRPPWRS